MSVSNISISENMAEEKNLKKDFECVELGDLQQKDEHREKTPHRVIHFSSGETMEEYSTEEEDGPHPRPEKNNLLSPVDTSSLTWGPYAWFQMWRAATNTVAACDYMGEKVASFFGVTFSRNQNTINQCDRTNRQEIEPNDSPVSEEAESHSDEKQNPEILEQHVNMARDDHSENLSTETLPEPDKISTETPPEPENLSTETPPTLRTSALTKTPLATLGTSALRPPAPENLNVPVTVQSV